MLAPVWMLCSQRGVDADRLSELGLGGRVSRNQSVHPAGFTGFTKQGQTCVDKVWEFGALPHASVSLSVKQ